MSIQISFIIPTFNSSLKIGRCLESLDLLAATEISFEAIFIDDASGDNTFQMLEEYSSQRPWVKTLALSTNSGSPSAPRNLGIRHAEGNYIFFLDSDDVVLPSGILSEIALAQETDADVVRTPLLRYDGTAKIEMNSLKEWNPNANRVEKISNIIQNQSTTVCGLIRRELLTDNEILWPTSIRMGEDTLFLIEVLLVAENIQYNPKPNFVYYVDHVAGSDSSTQSYEERELQNHLTVWRLAIERLSLANIDYFLLRGQVALQNTFASLIHRNVHGISRELFDEFQQLVSKKQEVIDNFDFSPRNLELKDFLLSGDFEGFGKAIKPRLLIAGYDLKFILSALPSLGDYFQIRLDEWKGHDMHDFSKSQELLNWAEVIHCEWLLGNAVWYSKNKKDHQKMVVRTHLFEISRDFGDLVEVDEIDRFIAVSLPTMEDIQKRFSFPRNKIRLVPNYIDCEAYNRSENPDKVYNLAIVGILPARKGFQRALELLRDLKKIDSRYNLTVYGKAPADLPWVANDPAEKSYFDQCDRYISSHALDGSIHYSGWADLKTELADKGVVLSVSDFESFHVAPAEAFAAGNVALFLPWRGVEYIYPKNYIFEDIYSLRDKILALRDPEVHRAEALEGSEFVRSHYDIKEFVNLYVSMVRGISVS